MKKLIGILVLFFAITTTSLKANDLNTMEEVGVGDCFGMRNQAMRDALAGGMDYWDAFDFAGAVFDACIQHEQ